MPIPGSINDLDAVAANNSPGGSEPIGPNLDGYLRAHAAIIRQLHDDLALETGSTLIGVNPEEVLAVLGDTLASALAGISKHMPSGVNVLAFMSREEQQATLLDHALDNTASVIAANNASKVLVFPAGHKFNLMNWEPREGTTILAHGAEIRRYASGVTFGTTGSSGTVILSEDHITVHAGTWCDRPDMTHEPWSGAFIINGGSNCLIHDGYEIRNTWGAISGHEFQNGGRVSHNLRVINGHLHHNGHNTYFADVDGLTFVGNVSEYSDRDGFKTYRNVVNTIACLNHCRYNGNGTIGQSQDGMDFFIGGERCIIALNFLQNNFAKGLDIKRSDTGINETYQNRKYIIGMNFISENGDIGLQTELAGAAIAAAGAAGKMPDLMIMYNHMVNNGGRGAYLGGLLDSQFIGNHLVGNGAEGLRVDDADGLLLSGNFSRENNSVGMNIVSGSRIFATGNVGRGGDVQTSGMLWSETAAGRCYDNDFTGHVTDVLANGANPVVRGRTIISKISNTANSQLVGLSTKCAIVQIELLFNNVAQSDVVLSRRSEVTGAHAGNITAFIGTTVGAISFPTPYVSVLVGVNGTNSTRRLPGRNALLLTLSKVTGSFTEGICHIHYID